MIPGGTVEGGGDLIGTNHPLWEAYRKRFGLKFITLDDDDYATPLTIPIILRGRSLSREEGKKLYDDMDHIFAAITAESEPINADAPWLSPKAAELDAMTTAARLAQIEGDELARYAVAVQLGSNNGVPLARQSYLAISRR